MQLSGRNFLKTGVSKDFRYGYQGSEEDDEVKGDGNSYTTEYRFLDPRLGRWLTVDPKAKSIPWQSSYCSMDNNPINLTDPRGDITDKQEKRLRKEKTAVDKRLRNLSKQEKNWAERYAKKVGGHVVETNEDVDEDHTMKRYKVSTTIFDDEGIYSEAIAINGNKKIGYKISTNINRFNRLRDLVDGFYFHAGETMGLSISIGYDAYVGGGIGGSTDVIFMGGETCIGGTFGGGIGLGGGVGIDVAAIKCTKSGRYRAKDIQAGNGFEFSVGIGPASYSVSGDQEEGKTSGQSFSGATNTSDSRDIYGLTSKDAWMSLYNAVFYKSLNSLKAEAAIKYEWNKSSVWGNW